LGTVSIQWGRRPAASRVIERDRRLLGHRMGISGGVVYARDRPVRRLDGKRAHAARCREEALV
jgi:hypothetical protein